MSDDIVIAAARRTPVGSFQGALSPLTAPQLGAAAIRAALADARVDGGEISEVIMGCVLPAGLGQAPARQAALAGGVPEGIGCTTINKVCGSGMKAVMLAHDLIRAGSADIVLAGGMESMSNAPYLLPKAREGYRIGHQEVIDHMYWDGLQSPWDGHMMGHFAEVMADKYGFTREAQDAFAIRSTERAIAANESGAFAAEIVEMRVKKRKTEEVVTRDEEPFRIDLAKIPSLPPVFRRDGGTVTAASSSKISDGGAALVIMRESEARRRGVQPLTRIRGHSGFAQAPEWFTTAPIFAIRALQEKLRWTPAEVDLYEINEAFAVVTMGAMQDLGLEAEKVNVNGGACALGHPIGCSGARIIVTLAHALRARGARTGIASLCIGGGEATAIGIEVS
jgi:acetyl-CoA C-acetyltransferase